MEIRLPITINKPVASVFATFTDLNIAKETLTGIKSLEIIQGSEQMAVGTRWKETREMMGKDSTEEMWVTELTQNKSYKVAAESHGTKYLSTFLFEEQDGKTKVTWIFEGIPQTFAAKMMSLTAKLFMGPLKKMMYKDLEELKAACESQ